MVASSKNDSAAPAPPQYDIPVKFKNPKGDVILRSSEGLDFRVYKVMLSEASTVFEDMFQALPPMKMSNEEVKDGVQVVVMEEPACVISPILQLCYPMEDPVIEKLDQLRPVLTALIKYQMDGVWSGWIKKMLSSVAEAEPWGVYATALTLGRIGCHYQMVDEVRLAARMTLRHPIGGPSVDELALITGADYHRVMQYHHDCRTRLTDLSVLKKIFEGRGNHWVWKQQVCGGRTCQRTSDWKGYNSSWWGTYAERIKVAMEKQPWGPAVESETLWMDLVQGLTSTCNPCGRVAISQMPSYVKQLSKAIEDEISQIKLEIA